MYTIYAKDGSEQAQLRTPIGAVEVVNIMTGMRPDEADPPTTAEEQAALLVRNGHWSAGYGYRVVRVHTMDPKADELNLTTRGDGAVEMTATVDGEQRRHISRDKGDSWTPMPIHSAMLRQLADKLEGVQGEGFLSAEVQTGFPQLVMKVQLRPEAFLEKFGPVGVRTNDTHVHYSATHDGIRWTANRPMTAAEHQTVAAALKAVH